MQPRRNAKAAKRFLRQLIARFGQPRVTISDKLRSYLKPIRQLVPDADHRAHKGIKSLPTDPEAREAHGFASNHPGRHRDFWLLMIKSTPSFGPAAIDFAPSHTAKQDQMPLISGSAIHSK